MTNAVLIEYTMPLVSTQHSLTSFLSVIYFSWQQDDSVDVMEAIMNTVFFKTVDLAYKEGKDTPSV